MARKFSAAEMVLKKFMMVACAGVLADPATIKPVVLIIINKRPGTKWRICAGLNRISDEVRLCT